MRHASFLLWFGLICAPQAVQALAANHLHPAPLPIPSGIYGNIAGCLLLHGDEPEGAPLWLTPSELGANDLQCIIESWRHDASGLVSFDCGARKYVVSLPSMDDGWFTVIERVDRLNFSTYQVAQCGPE